MGEPSRRAPFVWTDFPTRIRFFVFKQVREDYSTQMHSFSHVIFARCLPVRRSIPCLEYNLQGHSLRVSGRVPGPGLQEPHSLGMSVTVLLSDLLKRRNDFACFSGCTRASILLSDLLKSQVFERCTFGTGSSTSS